MEYPLQWNTLTEAASFLTRITGRVWDERRLVDACLRYYKPISHAEPRPSYLTGAPPKDTAFSLLKWTEGEGLVRQHAMSWRLLRLWQANITELLTAGETDASIASSPICPDGMERTYIMTDSPVRLDLSRVGISVQSLNELLAAMVAAHEIEVVRQSENNDDADSAGAGVSKGRRERQIDAILTAAVSLQYDAMHIPDGGKAKIREICIRRSDIFTDSGFIHAWKAASAAGKVAMANKGKYLATKGGQ